MRAKRIHSSSRPVFSSQLNGVGLHQNQPRSCGAVFVIFLILVTLGVGAWRAVVAKRDTAEALASATKVADQFMAAAERQDYKSDQLYLTPSGQYTLSPDALTTTFNILTTQWGQPSGFQLQNRELESIAGLDMCKCDYSFLFERGSITVHLTLVRGYKGWKVNTMSTD